MLEKLREKFATTFEKLPEFLHKHSDIADAIVKEVAQVYKDFDGDKKMEFAIALFLEQVHVPAPIAIYSSHKVVDTVEKFLQARYDASKQA